MKYLNLKTVLSLLKLMNKELPTRYVKYCAMVGANDCDRCGKRLLHTKFFIKNNKLYATSKCEYCNIEKSPDHLISSWGHVEKKDEVL